MSWRSLVSHALGAPQRFSDLRRALPAASLNVLADCVEGASPRQRSQEGPIGSRSRTAYGSSGAPLARMEIEPADPAAPDARGTNLRGHTGDSVLNPDGLDAATANESVEVEGKISALRHLIRVTPR